MEKTVAIPTIKKTKYSLSEEGVKLFDKFANVFWSLRCRHHNYRVLVQKTVSAIEDILERQSLKNSFYDHRNFEISIDTKVGWSLNLAKAFTSVEENIILILYKDMLYGQTTYSVTFSNIAGKITGIQNMYQGFYVDSYFHDEESNFLNPNVLANLLVAKNHLAKGTITEMNISNKPIFFGPMNFTERIIENPL